MTYTELKKQHQDKLTILIDRLGIFWAFSDKQLTEGLDKLKLTTADIISFGAGMLCPRANYEEYKTSIKALNDEFVGEMKKLNPAEVIEYELSNHECYYTGDPSEIFDLFDDIGYTKEQILKVYNDTKEQHND